MARLLYCSMKGINQANGEYYSVGGWPQIIPSLANHFDKTYLMTTIQITTQNMVANISKFDNNDKLSFIHARNTPLRRILPFWSIINLKLFRYLQNQVDVVLIAIPNSMPYLGFLPLRNRPLVAYLAGDREEVLRASNPSFLTRTCYLRVELIAQKFVLEHSDIVVCPSIKLKKKLIDQYRLPELKVHGILSLGVRSDIFKSYDLKRKREFRKKLKLDDSQIIGFVSVGITVGKGGSVILDVFHRIKKEIPNVKLLLIGEDKIGIPNDESIIHFKSLKREELVNYYNAMDIFVYPSFSDSGPKVVMEAAMCGIPIVSTRVGVVPELVSEGRGGFAVEVGDVDGMVNYCQRLLLDETLRRRIGGNAGEYAIKMFDSDKWVERLSEIIKSTL